MLAPSPWKNKPQTCQQKMPWSTFASVVREHGFEISTNFKKRCFNDQQKQPKHSMAPSLSLCLDNGIDITNQY